MAHVCSSMKRSFVQAADRGPGLSGAPAKGAHFRPLSARRLHVQQHPIHLQREPDLRLPSAERFEQSAVSALTLRRPFTIGLRR